MRFTPHACMPPLVMDAFPNYARALRWLVRENICPRPVTSAIAELDHDAQTLEFGPFVPIQLGQSALHVGPDELVELAADLPVSAGSPAHAGIPSQVV